MSNALRQMYALYRGRGQRWPWSKGLVLPAHDYVLKCSHTFNILDTRGAVGVTERQALFGKMRDLARRVAEAYLEQRQRLEFPWLKRSRPRARPPQPRSCHPCRTPRGAPGAIPARNRHRRTARRRSGMRPWRSCNERVPAWLDELRLAHGECASVRARRAAWWCTVKDLAPRQPDRTAVVKGPPAARAFDAAGRAHQGRRRLCPRHAAWR